MTVIIGAGTTVTSDKISSGIISVSFEQASEVQRLFQLGSFSAFDINITVQETISISNYGGTSTPIELVQAVDCTDSTASMDITIVPAPCTGSTVPIVREGSDALFITSFSYSKEIQGYGQESWSLSGKPQISDFTGDIAYLQGFAEGNRLTGEDVVSDDGIVLVDSTTGTPGQVDATNRSLSVSAGALSMGTDDYQDYGQVTRIGGSVGMENGKRGTSSATIPHEVVFF